ncbi:4-hydroxy-2-oxovalerate aldolase [Candidatus Woesearchaeota archaeon]|nr:4-hydroxy-2-oxovalerate aldolase [Candidatus Woesearchaeota archaeon]
MKNAKNVTVLETTLRDGSYAINFSFTPADTAIICKNLQDVGFKFIEIGHGVGLNASGDKYGKAVATDEEYLDAANSVLKKTTKFGMFCIPRIARLCDLRMAAKHNMGFVRVGTNVSDIESSKEFIKLAKDSGMFVAANFMKSYALTPEQFAEKVKLSEKYGADMVYVVDSAGGMFMDDVEKYVKAIRKVSSIPLGFHGHDNLGLGVANSLVAADMGVDFIDSSLQGLGRSSGNAATETLIAALHKRGYTTGIDFLKLLYLGQKFIQPVILSKGKMPLDIVSGYAEFHSSYMPHVLKIAAAHEIDPAELIIRLCEIDKVNLDHALLDRLAKSIKHKKKVSAVEHGIHRYVGHEQDQR